MTVPEKQNAVFFALLLCVLLQAKSITTINEWIKKTDDKNCGEFFIQPQFESLLHESSKKNIELLSDFIRKNPDSEKAKYCVSALNQIGDIDSSQALIDLLISFNSNGNNYDELMLYLTDCIGRKGILSQVFFNGLKKIYLNNKEFEKNLNEILVPAYCKQTKSNSDLHKELLVALANYSQDAKTNDVYFLRKLGEMFSSKSVVNVNELKFFKEGKQKIREKVLIGNVNIYFFKKNYEKFGYAFVCAKESQGIVFKLTGNDVCFLSEVKKMEGNSNNVAP